MEDGIENRSLHKSSASKDFKSCGEDVSNDLLLKIGTI